MILNFIHPDCSVEILGLVPIENKAKVDFCEFTVAMLCKSLHQFYEQYDKDDDDCISMSELK